MTKRKPKPRPWWKFWRKPEQPPKALPYNPEAKETGTTRIR